MNEQAAPSLSSSHFPACIMLAPRAQAVPHTRAPAPASLASPTPSPSIFFPAILPEDLHAIPPPAATAPALPLPSAPASSSAPHGRARAKPAPGKRRRQETRELRRVTSKRYRDALGGLYGELERLVPAVLPTARLRTKCQIIARAADALNALVAAAALADARAALHAQAARAAWVYTTATAASRDKGAAPYGAAAAERLAQLLVDYRWAYAEVWTDCTGYGKPGEVEESDVSGRLGKLESEYDLVDDRSVNVGGFDDGRISGVVAESSAGIADFRMRKSFTTLHKDRIKDFALSGGTEADAGSVTRVAVNAEPSWQVLVDGGSGVANANFAAGVRGTAARSTGFVVSCSLPLVVHGVVHSVVVLFNDSYTAEDLPHLAVSVDLAIALGDQLSHIGGGESGHGVV